MSPDARATCAIVLVSIVALTIWCVCLIVASEIRRCRERPPGHIEQGRRRR